MTEAVVPAAPQDLLRTIIDATPVGVCITDERGIFEQVNPAYERFYGYPADELLGRPFTLVVPAEHRAELADLHDRFLREGAEIRGEWEVERRDGSRATILADACRIVGPDGRPRKVTFVLDITERTRTEAALAEANARLEQLAMHDELTGFANRRRSLEALRDAVGLASRYGGELSVVVLDLDHFKRVNDSWGHAVGDAVLTGVADALRSRVRTTDTPGRLGGEEFVLVLPGTSPDDAVLLVRELQERVRDLVTLPDGAAVTFSAGVVGWAAGEVADDVLRRADRAMYRAKDAGRNRAELG